MTKYIIVKTFKQIHTLIKYCKQTRYASIDFETKAKGPMGNKMGKGKMPMGFSYKEDEPTVLGISFQAGSAYVIPLFHFDSPFTRKEAHQILRLISREILEDPDIVKIAQNAKFEHKWLKRYGCNIKGRLFDTMLMKYLLDEEIPMGLKDRVAHYYPELAGYDDEVGILVKQYGGWEFVPLKPLCKYNAMDCDYTLRIFLPMEQQLIKDGLYDIFRNLLMMAHRVLTESEYEGILVDKEYLDRIVKEQGIAIDKNLKALLRHKKVRRYAKWRMRKHIKGLIKDMNKEIKALDSGEKEARDPARMIAARQEKISRYIAGDLQTKKERIEDVNFNSSDQMGELLFKKKGGFGFKCKVHTETGKPGTSEEVIESLKKKDKSGFLDGLLDHRGMTKIYSTYMVGIQNRLTDQSRVHGSFLIHGTVTGRLSSREPNLQNVPRDTTSSLIKPMFICPPGYLMMQLDYAQAELRVLAEFANERAMIKAFKEGHDIHLATACRTEHTDYDDILPIYEDEGHFEYVKWKKLRKKAKTTNFGIVYEEGYKKLAEGLDISHEAAKEVLEEYFELFPDIKKFIKKQHNKVAKNGLVRNAFGRIRRLPDIWSENYGEMLRAQRQSTNAPIQGTASDFALFSSILIREAKLKGLLPWDMSQIYTVHDSLGFYVQPQDIHEVVPILSEICENPETKRWFGFEFKKVKMAVDFEVGDDWGHLKRYSSDIEYNTSKLAS